jgi:hypothetical protein
VEYVVERECALGGSLRVGCGHWRNPNVRVKLARF